MSGEQQSPAPGDGSLPLSEFDVRLNWVEELISGVSPTDDYMAALLEAQRLEMRNERQRGMMDGSLSADENEDGGMFSIVDEGALPEDALGMMTRDTQPNNTGPAMFQLNGTRFYAIVRNTDNDTLQAGTSVRVIEDGNRVTSRGAGGYAVGVGNTSARTFRYRGRLYEVPMVATDENDVKVSNQRYVEGEYENVDSELGPGEEKVVAEIRPPRDSFFLLKYTNASNHPTVEYEYYIDNTQRPDDDLSGTTPWGQPPDLYEVVPDGFRLIEDFVQLVMVETDGSTEYSDVQGTLTGIEIEV